MPHPLQVLKMCAPFDTHLDEARRMDRDHKYAKQLNELDKQHKFVLLRSMYGGDYDAGLRRSLLVNHFFSSTKNCTPGLLSD